MAEKKKRKFSRLFWIFLILFLIDVIIPDPLPVIDELVLMAGTIYFGSIK